MQFLTNLDLARNEIQNVALQRLTQSPSDPVIGQVYYNTQDKRVYCWTGDIWLPLDAKDARPNAASIVSTINNGSALIKQDKIDGLSAKLSGARDHPHVCG